MLTVVLDGIIKKPIIMSSEWAECEVGCESIEHSLNFLMLISLTVLIERPLAFAVGRTVGAYTEGRQKNGGAGVASIGLRGHGSTLKTCVS